MVWKRDVGFVSVCIQSWISGPHRVYYRDFSRGRLALGQGSCPTDSDHQGEQLARCWPGGALVSGWTTPSKRKGWPGTTRISPIPQWLLLLALPSAVCRAIWSPPWGHPSHSPQLGLSGDSDEGVGWECLGWQPWQPRPLKGHSIPFLSLFFRWPLTSSFLPFCWAHLRLQQVRPAWEDTQKVLET